MGLKPSKSKGSVSAQTVAYAPPGYETPFGTYKYTGGNWVSTPSADEGANITTRQQIIKDLLPDLGKTGDQRAAQIQQYKDQLTQNILKESAPLFTGEMYAKGLGGSTAYSSGYANLLNDALQRGIFGGEDLAAQDENSKINRLGAVDSGLQNAFARMMGISQQGSNQAEQYLANQQFNANQIQQANMANAAIQQQQQNQSYNTFAQLAGLAGLGIGNVLPNLIGGKGYNVGANALQTSAGGKTGKTSYFKDPNSYAQMAQLAAMGAGMFCWVASEIFDGWYKPKTIFARVYVGKIAPRWFRNFYLKHGQVIAGFIKKHNFVKQLARPIFEYFAFRGSVAFSGGLING